MKEQRGGTATQMKDGGRSRRRLGKGGIIREREGGEGYYLYLGRI